MLRIGKSTAIQVVDQRPCSLISALSIAIYSSHIGLTVIINRFHRFDKVLRGPCTLFLINILHCACRFKNIPIDCHGMRCHTQRIFIIYSVIALACALHGIIDCSLRLIGPQVCKIHHQSPCSPVGYQSFRSFQNDIRRLLSLNGSVNLVIAIRVVQILNRHFYLRMNCVKTGNQSVHCS